MSTDDDTSVLSAGRLEPLGQPRDVVTGLPIPPAGDGLVSAAPPMHGVQTPVPPPAGPPPEPDPLLDARSSLPEPRSPEEDAEARRKRDLAAAMVAAALAAGVPPPHRNVIVPDAPPGGRAVEFDGDPDEPVLPATAVIYWRSNTQWAGWLEPCPAMVIEPVYAEDVPGGGTRLTGAYRLQRFARIHGAMFGVQAARPSPVPRDGYFTPVRQYPPEACRVRPGT